MYNFSNLKESFKKAEDWLQHEYASLHTGKSSPVILDGITISSYGVQSPIKNVASISIEDAKTLRVSPWDKAHVKEIEKAINDSNIGLSVVSDGEGLRVIFPLLTTETRQKLVKVLKELLEEARISVRKEREKVQDDIRSKEKTGEMTEDEKFRSLDELQKLVDETNKNLEALFNKKEAEVMTV